MKLIDKLLLVGLIVMLPVGAFIFQKVLKSEPVETVDPNSPSTIDLKGLEKLISDTVTTSQRKALKPPEFEISIVNYATESGTLTIAGRAPVPNDTILASVSLIHDNSDLVEIGSLATQSSVPEQTSRPNKVDLFSIIPNESGAFTFEYQIFTGDIKSTIDLRLDQNQSVKNIRFDLETKRQLL